MECEDVVGAGMRFANGALGGLVRDDRGISRRAASSSRSPARRPARRSAGGGLHVAWHDGREEHLEGEARTGGGADPMAFSHEAHRALIGDFLAAIRDDREPAITGRERLAAHRLIDALLLSARDGRRIDL